MADQAIRSLRAANILVSALFYIITVSSLFFLSNRAILLIIDQSTPAKMAQTKDSIEEIPACQA
jgi:hypothetical protein